MKYFIVILMLFVGTSGFSQELVTKSKAATEQSLTKTATKTTMVYKGQPVFKSSKGSLFVVKKSKNGNFYKLYLEQKS